MGIVICLMLILVVRLWFLQIHSGAEFTQRSENNRIRMHYTIAPRGNIIDRHGRIIVNNRPSFNVVWIREYAPNSDAVIKKLAKILNTDIVTILDRIRAGADHPRHMPVRLQEDIDWKTLVYIENNKHNLPGVRIEVVPKRDYLFGSLASHLIGHLGEIDRRELQKSRFASYQSGDRIGKKGLERIYEEYLAGEKGKTYIEVNKSNFQQRLLQVHKALSGNDLQLTIDIDLQQKAEDVMADKSGAIIVVKVNSGKILAMASAPAFSLEEFVGGISSKAWQAILDNPMKPLLNKAIQGQYPPASVYKMITALAALSEGIITPETVFYCTGSLVLHNRRYHCWNRRGHGAIDLKAALAESCDVYFYYIAKELNIDVLAHYAKSFGLGRKTDINLKSEKSGLVPTAAWKLENRGERWQDGETLSASIGQSFNKTTPLQIVRMMAAMVNGGILYRPLLVTAIKDPEGGIIQEFFPVVDGKSLGTEEHLRLIKEALVATVHDKDGTGKAAKLTNITVGGKTGTAQVVQLKQFEDVPDEEIPHKFRHHAWFTGFAPAEKPEVAIVVLVEHGGGGGAVAAPLAREVLQTYFDLQQVKKFSNNQ